MQGLLRSGLTAVALALTGAPAANAQNDAQAFMIAIIDRGEACGLLAAWEAAAVSASLRQDLAMRNAERRRASIALGLSRSAEMTCDDAAMTMWIDAARQGIEHEILPPYLIAYRVLARMDAPPATFVSAARRLDFEPAMSAIDDALAALDAAGVRPEGGGEWEDAFVRTSDALDEMAAVLAGAHEGDSPLTPDDAAALIVDAAVITELWLAANQERD